MSSFWIMIITVCLGDMAQNFPFEQKFQTKEACMRGRDEAFRLMDEKPDLWNQFSCRKVQCREVK